MNRRGFLGLIAAAPVAAVLAPDLVELLAPKRTIFLPPRGGWVVDASRYLTSDTAWFLKAEHAQGVKMFWREPLDEASLERAFVAMVGISDRSGRRITYQPSRLIVHPSWTPEQIEERLRSLL